MSIELRALPAEDYPAWIRAKYSGFGYGIPESQLLNTPVELDRSLAAYDSGRIVGTINVHTFRMRITQRDRLYMYSAFNRCRKKAWMERKYGVAFPCRPFRKDCDALLSFECFSDSLDAAPRRAFASPLNKQRPTRPGQAGNQRPLGDFRLAQKCHRHSRA